MTATANVEAFVKQTLQMTDRFTQLLGLMPGATFDQIIREFEAKLLENQENADRFKVISDSLKSCKDPSLSDIAEKAVEELIEIANETHAATKLLAKNLDVETPPGEVMPTIEEYAQAAVQTIAERTVINGALGTRMSQLIGT